MNAEQPKPSKDREPITEATDTILVVAEGPADTTVRPRRPNIPLTWSRPTPPRDERAK